MRRATDTWDGAETFDRISIHALHEESDEGSRPAGLVAGISIHALHEESDPRARRRTGHDRDISIHALHEESDSAPFHVSIT